MNQLNFEFDVRIPNALIQQMMDGEITGAMLLTMTVLYKWANWSTGRVRRVCASSLCLATNKAFSERTFSEALRKLEWMRWITRQMVTGSTRWYPVTLHNYKIYDDAGKVQIINPTDIKVYEKFPEGRCDEASWEASDEGSDEASDEGSDRHESEHQSQHDSQPLSQNKSENNTPRVSSVIPQSDKQAGLVAGYTAEQIAKQAELCRDNPWVKENDTPRARTRDKFVKHLMENCEPPKRVPRSGSHAEKNPELHTGIQADGKSWVGTQCRVCDLVRTDNENGVCDYCHKPKI